jgi:predicted Rossmann fold nucleotide-binding protein DprA/Smf involved in DNA uptake
MSFLTQDSLAILALTNRIQDSDEPVLRASEVWRLLEQIPEPSTLLGLDSRMISEKASIPLGEAARVSRRLDSGVALAVKLDSLLEMGIVPVTAVDKSYPRRLRQRLDGAAPPVLYCAGELSLLATDGIGVVGSRDIGQEAVEATRSIAQVIASAGIPLVSGGAKGVDKISMAVANEAGGPVVGVLADSLEQAISRRDNRQALLEGVACLCTPYSPTARFTAGNAMGRNKIIYGLSRVTVVVTSSHGEGGTWAGATEALRKRYGRVAVWIGPGSGPGNTRLVKEGGVSIDRPESILEVDELDQADGASAQMALTFNGTSDRGEQLRSVEQGADDVDGRASMQGGPPARGSSDLPTPPAGALAPRPTGTCWCGCGKPVEGDTFFVSRHAPGAAQRAVLKHFGSVEAFLLMLGEAPDPDGRTT